MGFKKQKINKTNSFLINFIGLISIFIIVFTGFTFFKNVNFIKLDILEQVKNTPFVPSNVTKNNEDNEIDEINFLIVGRGGGTHEAPNLTDTIIFANVNFDLDLVSMLSIPRDLYVEYNNEKEETGKINEIYAKNAHKDGENAGMKALGKKIEEIVNQKIDYYINIDFNGFKALIDTIGGIELTIPEQFIDYQYPDGERGYKTIVFKKGTWLFDGENALKYARSRHSTSDFDRSLRQQQIIDAIRNKLTAGYFLNSPSKIKELYNVFTEYIYTDLKLQDVLKLAIKVKSSNLKLQSFNLNDSCFYGSDNCISGGFLYTPNREFFGGASILLPEGCDVTNISNYDEIHKYTNLIFNNSDLYTENYKINVLNSLSINFLASLLADNLAKYGLNIPSEKSIGNTQTIYTESIIYYNNLEEDSKIIQTLKDFFPNIKLEKTDGVKFAKELDVNIEIVIGEDYKKVFNQVF